MDDFIETSTVNNDPNTEKQTYRAEGFVAAGWIDLDEDALAIVFEDMRFRFIMELHVEEKNGIIAALVHLTKEIERCVIEGS